MTTHRSLKTETLIDGFTFLEGPRWSNDRLWFSDMFGGKVHSVDAQGDVETVVEIPERPSGLGFQPDGSLLICSMTDRRLLRLEGGKLSTHADLHAFVTGDINDMVVDPNGRAFVGSFGFDMFGGAEFRSGNIVMVEPNGDARVVADDMAFPNGTVIVADKNMLVVAESYGSRLSAFDIRDDGSLLNRREFARFDDGSPDGICLDQEGGIWVSLFEQGAFLRVLEGGHVTHRIDLDDRFAVACQLGGEDGRTLFCLTTEGSWEDVSSGKSKSRIEVTRVDVPGAGSP